MKRFLKQFSAVFIVIFSLTNNVLPKTSAAGLPKNLSSLPETKGEPIIRIGLATGLRAVSITANDSLLTTKIGDAAPQIAGVSRISVAARAYRPPVVENFFIEIPNIATREEADALALEIRGSIEETVVVLSDLKTNAYKIRIGDKIPTRLEADEMRKTLAEKGFEDAVISVERETRPSSDALAVSKAKADARRTPDADGKLAPPANNAPNDVQPLLDPNLREVVVSGGRGQSFSSVKPVSFGTTDERNIPVRFNGRPYRGRIEVFVNERGLLTVVNALKMEDYVLGVVPNELGLPELEAQKAQAVAARTYAIKNLGQFAAEGFDLLPTIRSQVYKGFASENAMATSAVRQTAGVVATYRGEPINAMYTSTCGGRTENVENIYDHSEPYLRGVECSLEGDAQFAPYIIKTNRETPKIRTDSDNELYRRIALLQISGGFPPGASISENFLENSPTAGEMSVWLNNLAVRFGKPFGTAVGENAARPADFAAALAMIIYGADFADTLLSEADINYQLSFADGGDVPKEARAETAILLRDGWISLLPDATLKPTKSMSRARVLSLIADIYAKKKWNAALQNGVTKQTADGKMVLRVGKGERVLNIRPDAFLFRAFGDTLFPLKEVVLIGGETVNFHTDAAGAVDYAEIRPTTMTATAERFSSFTNWTMTLAPTAAFSRLRRYVRGLNGSLLDLKVVSKGVSRRATELEITTTTGKFSVKSGKIRSALRLKEQLFVINKRFDAAGRVISYSFTGRGWGHGIGMCQYGAYGFARAGLNFEAILKHYYTGIELTKMY